jgi:hypothetical protein
LDSFFTGKPEENDKRSIMKTVEILGANRFEKYTKTRDGSRAIIIEDGKILLTHELNSGWWLLPGGGIKGTYRDYNRC